MNYELAKELKDTGFPQLGGDKMNWDLDVFIESDGRVCRNWNRIDPEACRIPTLSELIAACGETFLALRQDLYDESLTAGKWLAQAQELEEVVGVTREEAVAKLWLIINKK